MAGVGQRRHIGLQQLEALSSQARSFLGPNKSLKFVQDESNGQAVLVQSCSRLYLHLNPGCSVGQLLCETVQAQQQAFGSGTGTLVFLTGAWSRVALECLNRGMSIIHINFYMSRTLQLCSDWCTRAAKNLQTIFPHQTESHQNAVRLKHSRHFVSQKSKSVDVNIIAQAISHGSDSTMKLVLQACDLQRSLDHCANTLDLHNLETCSVTGQFEEASRVLPGYVTAISPEQRSLVQRLQGLKLRVGLVNGDLTEQYRHIGFNKPGKVTLTTNRSSSIVAEPWEVAISAKLRVLNVKVLLVRGEAAGTLRDLCFCSDILLLEGVRSSILKSLSVSTGAIPFAYLSQLDEHSVGDGVAVEAWRDVCVVTAATSPLVTAVIVVSIPALSQIMEDEFWSCAHRLWQALTDHKLLPGDGCAELQFIHQLMCTDSRDPMEKLVMELMAGSWMEFVSVLRSNIGPLSEQAECETSQGVVYDVLSVKLEAWRRALDLVLLVLQTDTEIITGITEGQDLHCSLMCV